MDTKKLLEELTKVRTILENNAAHLRALDIKRRNKVGIKRYGFIQTARDLAQESQEFLPSWLSQEKFDSDNENLIDMSKIVDMTAQIHKLASNILAVSSDTAYIDALKFYSSVQEAAFRRIDPAETILAVLSEFFKSNGSWSKDMQTQKKMKQDFNNLLHGKKDGRIVIENAGDKVIKGKKRVIDETQSSNSQIQSSDSQVQS